MVGSNPWFKNARVPIESLGDEGEDMTQEERENSMMETLVMADRENLSGVTPRHLIIGEPEPQTAWKRLMGIMFGDGVALVAVPSATDKPMTKRRMRRLRGKLKEARR